jgi:hypothetical protein
MMTTTSRPTRRRVVASLLTAAVVGVWQTDPAWAQTAGLDVWNLGRLEDQMTEADVTRDKLAAREAFNERLYETNRRIVAEAMAGRQSLSDAAADLWQLNRDVPEYVAVLDVQFRGPTAEARAADNLIRRARMSWHTTAAERTAAVDRLTAEYRAMYGTEPTND